VALRNIQIEFVGGGKAWTADQVLKGPGVDVRPLPGWGIYARGVERLSMDNVKLKLSADDQRPAIMAERVKRIDVIGVHYPRVPGVSEPFVTNQVERVLRVPSR